MSKYQYILEKGSKKYHCPDCKRKTFVRYTDTETGNYLPEQYGRCDRESKCSYHLNPYSDGYETMISKKENANHSVNFISWKPQRIQPTEPVFFDYETFKQTLQHYEDTMFIQNLFTNVFFPFEVEDVTKVIQLYRLGTVAKGYRAGAISFAFIDLKGNVRTVFQSRKYIIKGSCVSN